MSVVVLWLIAHAGGAVAATISGTITDHSTGAPIREAQLTVDLVSAGEGQAAGLTVGQPVARPETDSSGHWEAQVAPGTYWIWAEASGYFNQGIGAPTGNNGSPDLEIGESGRSGLDASMVLNTSPFIGLFPTVMRWSHEAKGAFRSMVLQLEYGGFAALPASWSSQHLISHIVDSQGKPVWPSALTVDDLVPPGGEGEGGTSNELGSASGCGFFGSSKQQPDVEHLKVVSYLESDPTLKAEEAITPDFSECKATEILLRRPLLLQGRRLDVTAEIEDRLAGELAVPGIMTFLVNGHRPVVVHTKDATTNVIDFIKGRAHPGWNRIVVSFSPSISTVTPPPTKHLRFKIPLTRWRSAR